MATFEFDPTPLFGGFFNRFLLGQYSVTELDTGVFLLVFMQTDPNHMVAQVITLGLSSPLDIDYGPMRWIEFLGLLDVGFAPDIECVAMSATKAVVQYKKADGDIRFRTLDISGVGVNATITENTPNDITMTNTADVPDFHFFQGSKRQQMVRIDASNFYYYFMEALNAGKTASTDVFLARFSVTGSVVAKLSEDNTGTIMSTWNFDEESVGVGSNFDLTTTLTAGQFILTAGRSVAVIGPTSNKITDLSDEILDDQAWTLENDVGEYVNLHPGQRLMFYTAAAWGQILDYSDLNSVGTIVMEAFQLDATHFMMIQRSSTQAKNIKLQMVRKLSDIFWQHQRNSSDLLIPTSPITIDEEGHPNLWLDSAFWFDASGSNATVSSGPRFAYFLDSTHLATWYSGSNVVLRITIVSV